MRKVHDPKSIFVECYADENFLMNLGIVKKAIKHHENKYELIKALEKMSGKVALIDADPDSKHEKILDRYNLIDDSESIKQYYHKKTKNRILLIYPQLEGWLINECRKNAISLSSLGLPEKYSELHIRLHKLPDKHQRLIQILISKDSKGINRIKSLLNLV
ncbi:MAG: hypothetical protein MUC87_13310 [Bacteroidia bacterium]|nr:hypothetical protein [Bacteroidia bacterium]